MTVDSRIVETASPPTVAEYLDALAPETRASLTALGDLLSGQPAKPKDELSDEFIGRALGVAYTRKLVSESKQVNGVAKVCVGLAVAEIAPLAAETGSGRMHYSPRWERVEIGTETLAIPAGLSLHYPDKEMVVRMSDKDLSGGGMVEVFARPERHRVAREFLDSIVERGHELNPYRGRILRAIYESGSLHMDVIELPTMSRTDIVVPQTVWAEIDLAISAVTKHAPLLDRLNLGCRRGVLLCGPPGTGKSAVSNVVARELNAAGFTVIYVAARGGASVLSEAVEEGIRLGPLCLVLEDIDLYIRDRKTMGGNALGELLQAMDVSPEARVLTLASTNDTKGMDAASIRSGRFDAVLEIGYPDRGASSRILDSLLTNVPNGDAVNTRKVATALKPKTSGADLREIVRRAVLTTGGEVTTGAFLSVIREGKYRPQLPEIGHYL
jgi:hypothetical protein